MVAGTSEGTRIENSIFFRVLGGGFHMHHRLAGLIGLVMLLAIETFVLKDRTIIITILKGIALGSIFHGLMYYTDYFQVRGLIKK